MEDAFEAILILRTFCPPHHDYTYKRILPNARLRFIESLDVPPFKTSPEQELAAVNGRLLQSSVGDLDPVDREDVLNSTLLAQLAANQAGGDDKVEWYKKYKEVLENVGWVVSSFSFSDVVNLNTYGSVDKVVIAMLDPDLSPKAREVVQATIDAMNLPVNASANAIFHENAWDGQTANFQIGVASASDGDNVQLHLGCFDYTAKGAAGNVLFFEFGHRIVKFMYATQTMVLNQERYKVVREMVKNKLGTLIQSYREDVVISV
ncbi:hypothetical protein SCP_1702850 [Sparassis crispa]|uniref:Uncharacterized protein n=1 Tax=Sparassis crispa TaxID=139825 RepID=A0A401H6E3_9APHY|nr:hypothetical protein SCP_1702850 [Sparassis crispa]GBE89959.1 hypothetical protein SCP_1702850 [Sparassis crispa]